MTSSSPDPATPDRHVWRDARIVVVDDEPSNLRLLQSILARAGYEDVHATVDPAELVDDYEGLQPDLLLVDLMMPGLDGVDVLERVRQLTPPGQFVPVLMLTADTGREAMRRALGAGVDDFLTKPFDTDEVRLRIANLLRTRQLSLQVNAHKDLLERQVDQRTKDLQLFRDVLATVPDPVVIEDPSHGTVVYVNAALTDEERADSPWMRGELASLAPDVADGTVDSALVEDVVTEADGTVRPVEILVHAINRGNHHLIVGIARDISDRVNTRRALENALDRERRATTELTRVANLKEAFLTAISHEIRTPLSVVNGAAQTLQRRSDQLDAQTTGELLARLSSNAQRLQDMLLDLLDLNNVVTGRMQLRPEHLRLDRLIRDRMDHIDLGDRPTRVTLPAVACHADPSKLTQAIDALLTNIAKHTPATTPVSVTVEGGPTIRIRISDGGPGIPDEFKQRIFAPFEHGPTSAVHSPGTGIGLTLARTFIHAHQGRLWVEDRPGGGATFIAELPTRTTVETPTP